MEESIDNITSKQGTARSKDPEKGINLSSIDTLEEGEIDEIIKRFQEMRAKEEKSQQNVITNSNDYNWLSNLFVNHDIEANYLHQQHAVQILIQEALYYLSLYYTIYSERIREKPLKRTSASILPSIQDNRSSIGRLYTNKNSMPLIKIGIVGCGNLGSALLKKLIEVKDKKKGNFKILVSTRRPDNVGLDIMNIMDDDVEIFLNNERVFNECDIIYLCVQPHQLDLLSKDMFNVLSERIEKLKKKKYKVFPFIISFLCATPIERLRMFFPPNTFLIRSRVLLAFRESPEEFEKQQLTSFIKESASHLIGKDNISLLATLLTLLSKVFYTVSIKDKNNNDKRIVVPIEEVPAAVGEAVLGKDTFDNYSKLFDIKTSKFSDNMDDKTKSELLNNFTLNYNVLLQKINF